MDIRIDHCILHGPEGDVRRAQRVLMNCPWPPVAEAEVLILRRIDVQAGPQQLPARLYQVTDALIGRRVDGWSEAAAAADCVHFRSEAEMFARLSLDLATGRAAGLWFWQSFRRHQAAPPAPSLADLWLEQARRLAVLTRVLRERRVLPVVWSALPARAAPHLLGRILGSAAAGELRRRSVPAPPIPDPPRPGPAAPALDAMPPIAPDLVAAVEAFGHRPGDTTPAADEKGLLALTLAVAAERPHWIAASDAARRLADLDAHLAHRVPVRAGGVGDVGQPGQRPGATGPPGPSPEPVARAEDIRKDRPPTTAPAGDAVAVEQGSKDAGRAMDPARTAPAAPPETPLAAERSGAPLDAAADRVPAAAMDVWRVDQGGLFYLLNLLDWRPVRERLFADLEAMAFPSGWGWVYRIGEYLGLEPEPPLIHCLTRLSGMSPGSFPADLPALSLAGEIAALGAERYGPFGVWHPGLLRIPARVELRRPEVDIHYAIADLEVSVRRAGLDVDPGWIDWLGSVVRFHYDPGDLV